MTDNPIIHGDGKSVHSSPSSGQTGGFERLSPKFRSSPAQPFHDMSEQEIVLRTRRMMKYANASVRECAAILGVVPWNNLDHLLWKHIATSSEAIREMLAKPDRPEPMF